MLENDEVTIPTIKSKKTTKLNYYITKSIRAIIQGKKEEIQTLIKNKEEEDFVITSLYKKEPVSRRYLTTHINEILRKTGIKHHKKLSSHSFQIGLTTALIETAGIDAARQIIGHENISTTAIYSRRSLGVQIVANATTINGFYRSYMFR